MTDHGFKTFTTRLRGLHDACGRKPPGDAGMVVWWDMLRNVVDHEVLGALDDWTRKQPKPPAPSDVYKLACDHATDRREQTWEQQKQAEKVAWSGPTAAGNAALQAILRGAKQQRQPGAWWAHKILERHAAGENVGYLPLVMAMDVADKYPMREPGQDDAEREVAA